MKGVRFYLEFSSPRAKRQGVNAGTVFAAFVCNGIHRAGYDGIGSVYDRPNSPVASSHASLKYIRIHCKRISEEKARFVHPALFKVLDKEET